jgi:hypothetical protein
MAKPPKEAKPGAGKALFWGFFFLAVLIAAASSFLYKESERAREALEDSKRDYQEMERLKRIIAEGKSRLKRLPSNKESGEDILPFLERKRAQAGIPQNLFTVARNSPVKQGGWIETSYTVTLRGTKEAPLPRASIVDFVVAVENERPSVKSRNLSLAFVPQSSDFNAVSITFSQFQRAE